MFKCVRPLAGKTFQEEFRSAGWCKENRDGQKTVAEDSTDILKITRKTVKNGQARTRESVEYKAEARKSGLSQNQPRKVKAVRNVTLLISDFGPIQRKMPVVERKTKCPQSDLTAQNLAPMIDGLDGRD
ncbi:hypothetical protein Tco_0268000 [Tanacetum coccineum]